MKRNRYILLACVILMSIFIFKYYVLVPESEKLRESMKSRYETLQKFRYYVKGAKITEDEIKASINDMKYVEERLMKEKSEFLASAKMQEVITDLIKKAGLNVIILRPLTSIKSEKYSTIPIYFEGNADIKQIGIFLNYVESNSFMIKIDKLNLNINNLQNPADLKFKMQVSGLLKL